MYKIALPILLITATVLTANRKLPRTLQASLMIKDPQPTIAYSMTDTRTEPVTFKDGTIWN